MAMEKGNDINHRQISYSSFVLSRWLFVLCFIPENHVHLFFYCLRGARLLFYRILFFSSEALCSLKTVVNGWGAFEHRRRSHVSFPLVLVPPPDLHAGLQLYICVLLALLHRTSPWNIQNTLDPSSVNVDILRMEIYRWVEMQSRRLLLRPRRPRRNLRWTEGDATSVPARETHTRWTSIGNVRKPQEENPRHKEIDHWEIYKRWTVNWREALSYISMRYTSANFTLAILMAALARTFDRKELSQSF